MGSRCCSVTRTPGTQPDQTPRRRSGPMNHHDLTSRRANAARYLEDFTAWCAQTAAAIRAGHWDTIDREALAEEVESLGKRESRTGESPGGPRDASAHMGVSTRAPPGGPQR